MTELYEQTAERLWEKLEFHKERLNIAAVDLSDPFFIAQLPREEFSELVNEVAEEFNFRLSMFQCSWAVKMLIRGDMDEYNKVNGTRLRPRK